MRGPSPGRTDAATPEALTLGTSMKKKAKRRKEAVACPFCGEAEEIAIDRGGGARQTYTEDCAVCCRPRIVHVEPGDEPGEVRVWLEREE